VAEENDHRLPDPTVFLLQWRHYGHPLTLERLVVVQRLLLDLAARGNLPADPRRWAGLLAPLFCQSAEEQETFHQSYGKWLDGWTSSTHPNPQGIPTSPGQPRPSVLKQALKTAQQPLRSCIHLFSGLRNRWWDYLRQVVLFFLIAGVSIALIAGVSIAGYAVIMGAIYVPSGDPFLFRRLLLAGIAVATASIVLRQQRRNPRSWLSRQPDSGSITESFPLYLSRDGLGDLSREARETARYLRQREAILTRDLDVEASLKATLDQGGLPTPILGKRHKVPEYLVLVDRRNLRDSQAGMTMKWLEWLREEAVEVSSWTFHGDPRYCSPTDPDEASCSLETLLARYHDRRLLIFAESRLFFDYARGLFQPWVAELDDFPWKLLAVPENPGAWGFRERGIQGLGMMVAQASVSGLQQAIARRSESLPSGLPLPEPSTANPFPPLLADDDFSWLGGATPERKNIARLMRELEQYLSDGGVSWLRACAIYPELDWRLTLQLGSRLSDPDGRTLFSQDTLLRLTRLPWFRLGSMPLWLRRELIRSINRRQRSKIRKLIWSSLLEGREHKDLALLLSSAHISSFSTMFKAWLNRQPDREPMRDKLFVSFLLGWRHWNYPLPLPPMELISRWNTTGWEIAMGLMSGMTVFLVITAPSTLLTITVASGFVGWVAFFIWNTRSIAPLSLVSPSVTNLSSAKPMVPQEPQPFEVWQDHVSKMMFVWIPPGQFTMGSPADEKGRSSDEGPEHEVEISGFWLGKYEVTQGEWERFMGENPSRFKKGDRYPVEQVSWDDVQKFIYRLNIAGDGGYRLPTEAEWEYACRGGTRTPFSLGETLIAGTDANFDGRQVSQPEGVQGVYCGETMPVGSFPANSRGLHDMHGNVWEWVHDSYVSEAYSNHAPQDPCIDIDRSSRIRRGGSWFDDVKNLRCASRKSLAHDDRGHHIGFRLAKNHKA